MVYGYIDKDHFFILSRHPAIAPPEKKRYKFCFFLKMASATNCNHKAVREFTNRSPQFCNFSFHCTQTCPLFHNKLFRVTQITQVWHILKLKKDKLVVWLALWTWTFKHPIKNLMKCNEINQLHPSHTYEKHLYSKKW